MFISTIQKYVIGGLILIIIGNAGLSVYYKHQRDKHIVIAQDARKQTQEYSSALDRTKRNLEDSIANNDLLLKEMKIVKDTMQVREDEIKLLNKEKDVTNAKLRNAIKNNPDWSNAPVPDSVQDALR